MRVFGIQSDDRFVEYVTTPFKAEHKEAILEKWLEANPDGILEDGPILIIGRQVSTNLDSFIDLLGLDREGNVVVVELKRDRTPRDVLAQAEETGLFSPAGRDLKCMIARPFKDSEIDALLRWVESVVEAVREYGLRV